MFRRISLPKDPILKLYLITVAILLLDVTNNFPMISMLRKMKYVLMFIMLMDAIHSRNFRINKKALYVLVLLFTHTILFGFVWINNTVIHLTLVHAREMLIYLILLTLTVEMIERKRCYVEFLECIVVAFSVFFIWIGITHFSHFVNPIYYPMVLMRNTRIRSNFGTASPNYVGYYAFVAIILYYLLWWTWKKRGTLTQGKKQLIALIAFWTMCILFSTASRSSIISLAIFAVICFIVQYKKIPDNARKWIIIFCIATAAIFLIFNWNSIWKDANRAENVSINIPIFNEMNAEWKGMGYLESSAFYLGFYGYDTWPVDIYYLYIYLTTGKIGSILIFSALIFILIVYLRKKKDTIRYILLAAYVAMLFDGFWQVNLFTYRYIATLFINAILLYFMGNSNEKVEIDSGSD